MSIPRAHLAGLSAIEARLREIEYEKERLARQRADLLRHLAHEHPASLP